MDDRASVLVLGATGLIGRAAATGLVEAGVRVEGVARRAPPAWIGFPVTACDRARPEGLEGLAARFTAVIDCCLASPADLRALSAFACDRYLFLSSGSVYDHRGAGPIREDAPLVRSPEAALSARTFERQRARVEREEAVRAWADGRCAATAIRAGVVLGPGDRSGRLARWRSRLSSSESTVVPDDAAVSFVDARDLGRLLAAELGRPDPPAWQVLNAGGPTHARAPRLLDLVRLLARQLDLPPHRIAPTSSARLLARGGVPWSDLPLWAPPGSPAERLMKLDSTRAQAAGLTWRPWPETVIDSLEGGP
jgi:2'-hydroxyisoflavone reductase